MFLTWTREPVFPTKRDWRRKISTRIAFYTKRRTTDIYKADISPTTCKPQNWSIFLRFLFFFFFLLHGCQSRSRRIAGEPFILVYSSQRFYSDLLSFMIFSILIIIRRNLKNIGSQRNVTKYPCPLFLNLIRSLLSQFYFLLSITSSLKSFCLCFTNNQCN